MKKLIFILNVFLPIAFICACTISKDLLSEYKIYDAAWIIIRTEILPLVYGGLTALIILILDRLNRKYVDKINLIGLSIGCILIIVPVVGLWYDWNFVNTVLKYFASLNVSMPLSGCFFIWYLWRIISLVAAK